MHKRVMVIVLCVCYMCELAFIFLQESSCPGSKPEECIVYCMSKNIICGTYKTETLKNENSVLRFTGKNTELLPNCSYTAIIETINKFGRTNSTEFVINVASEEGVCILFCC